MIDIMCDRLHLPAIIFTFPFYDHLHIILVCVQREGNSASIQSSQEPITLDFLLRLHVYYDYHGMQRWLLLNYAVWSVGLGWSMHGHEVPYIGLFSAAVVVASLHITWAVCVCRGGRCFYNFGLQSLYYAQPVQIALDCTVAQQQQRWTTVSFFCFFIALLLLLREIHLRRFVVFEWTDPVLCNTHDTMLGAVEKTGFRLSVHEEIGGGIFHSAITDHHWSSTVRFLHQRLIWIKISRWFLCGNDSSLCINCLCL